MLSSVQTHLVLYSSHLKSKQYLGLDWDQSEYYIYLHELPNRTVLHLCWLGKKYYFFSQKFDQKMSYHNNIVLYWRIKLTNSQGNCKTAWSLPALYWAVSCTRAHHLAHAYIMGEPRDTTCVICYRTRGLTNSVPYNNDNIDYDYNVSMPLDRVSGPFAMRSWSDPSSSSLGRARAARLGLVRSERYYTV